MPVEQAELVNANFSRGLITETGPLDYPQNSCKSLMNITVAKNGSARVRNGLTTHDHRNNVPNFTDGPVATFFWETPAEDGKSFVVYQEGTEIICAEIGEDYIGQTTIKAGRINRNGNRYTGLDTLHENGKYYRLRGRQVGKHLFLYSNKSGTYYLKYLPDGNKSYAPYQGLPQHDMTASPSVEIVAIPIHYRDLYGIADGVAADERPSNLSNKHKYNLRNAGWPQSDINKFFNANGSYPAIGDYYWFGYSDTPAAGDLSGKFEPKRFTSYPVSGSPAPSGHFLLNISIPSRRQASSGINLPSTSQSSGPSCTAFFAGRMWYAGFSDSLFSENVMFSQVIGYETLETYKENYDVSMGPRKDGAIAPSLGDCYQKSDPTARTINDLVDDDGGVIPIPGCGTIMGLETVGDSVVVIASGGVWNITGGLDPFSANNYSVEKVTDTGCISSGSVVKLADSIVYWSSSNIVVISPTRTSDVTASSISLTVIDSFYQAIPEKDKNACRGVYDFVDRRVLWFYGNGECLVYDIILGCFYPYQFCYHYDSNNNYVEDSTLEMSSAVIKAPTYYSDNQYEEYQLYYFCKNSWDDGNNNIILSIVTEAPEYSGIYTDLVPYYVTDPSISDTAFHYYSPIKAHVEVGATNFGDLMRQKKAFRIFTYFETTETRATQEISSFVYNLEYGDPSTVNFEEGIVPLNPTKCLAQGRWEWSSRPTSGKFSAQQPAYRTPQLEITGPGTSLTSKDIHIPAKYAGGAMPDIRLEYATETIHPVKNVVTSRMRVRGTGKVLNMRFDNEEGYGFHLLGWAAPVAVETRP